MSNIQRCKAQSNTGQSDELRFENIAAYSERSKLPPPMSFNKALSIVNFV